MKEWRLNSDEQQTTVMQKLTQTIQFLVFFQLYYSLCFTTGSNMKLAKSQEHG